MYDLQMRLVGAHLISRMRVYVSDAPPKIYQEDKDTAGNQTYVGGSRHYEIFFLWTRPSFEERKGRNRCARRLVQNETH